MIQAIQNIDGYEAMTPQEIADALKATGVTARPIDRAALVHLLNIRGMLRKVVSNNSDEKWTGTVLAMQDAILAQGTNDQKEAIRLWFSHITNVSNNKWDTTDPAFAVGFWQMFQFFAGVPNMPSTADFEAIAALGGGWLHAEVTAAQVTAALANQSRIAAQTAIIARINAVDSAVTAALDSESTPAEITAAAESAWGGQ